MADTARAGAMYRRHARFYDATRRFCLPDHGLAAEWLGVRPGDRVVDFACGTGRNVPHLLRAGPSRITGVDCSEEMLAVAARKFPGVRLVLADAATVSLPEPAERILCTYGLSMMDGWVDVLRNIHRHMAMNGSFVLLDFCPLRGVAAPLDPALRRWLGRFGVRGETDFEPVLAELFERVEVRRRPGGYRVLLRASGPRMDRASPRR